MNVRYFHEIPDFIFFGFSDFSALALIRIPIIAGKLFFCFLATFICVF